MQRRIVLSLVLVFSLMLSNTKVMADQYVGNVVPQQVESRELDENAKILADYFAFYGSPLEYHAQDFIDAAREFNVDWKLVPAISGVESTFGKFTPGGYEHSSTSYNAWGWGVYSNQAVYFASWREGIFTVTRGLKENYIDRGLTNPYAMNRIYATSPYWGEKVAYFMADLEKFAKDYEVKNQKKAQLGFEQKIVAISGKLVIR